MKQGSAAGWRLNFSCAEGSPKQAAFLALHSVLLRLQNQELICNLRTVSLQDMVLAFEEYHDHSFEKLAPFDSNESAEWSHALKTMIQADVHRSTKAIQQLAPIMTSAAEADARHAEPKLQHAEGTIQLPTIKSLLHPKEATHTNLLSSRSDKYKHQY